MPVDTRRMVHGYGRNGCGGDNGKRKGDRRGHEVRPGVWDGCGFYPYPRGRPVPDDPRKRTALVPTRGRSSRGEGIPTPIGGREGTPCPQRNPSICFYDSGGVSPFLFGRRGALRPCYGRSSSWSLDPTALASDQSEPTILSFEHNPARFDTIRRLDHPESHPSTVAQPSSSTRVSTVRETSTHRNEGVARCQALVLGDEGWKGRIPRAHLRPSTGAGDLPLRIRIPAGFVCLLFHVQPSSVRWATPSWTCRWAWTRPSSHFVSSRHHPFPPPEVNLPRGRVNLSRFSPADRVSDPGAPTPAPKFTRFNQPDSPVCARRKEGRTKG
eukprot:scaffold271_cov336-Pavlova_lutheri.AAC.43